MGTALTWSAGMNPVGSGPGGQGRCAASPVGRPLGVHFGHRQDVTGPPGADDLQVGGGHRPAEAPNRLVR